MNKNDSKLNSTEFYFTVLEPLLVIVYINGIHTALGHSKNKNNRDKLRPELTITFTIKQNKSTKDQKMYLSYACKIIKIRIYKNIRRKDKTKSK